MTLSAPSLNESNDSSLQLVSDSKLYNSNTRNSVGSLLILLGAITFLYFETIESITSIWWNSSVYKHGFLIIPLSVFLIVHDRKVLSPLEFQPSWVGATALALLSGLWWVSLQAGVQVGQHFALVSMIPAAVIATFGLKSARVIQFPLMYLLFAVPFGDFIIPSLMQITATLTTEFVNLFGIPVFRDGRYFYVPSGTYEVATLP